MEIINAIAAAIFAGAVASSKETASQAVKEAYAGLKRVIISRMNGLVFPAIEEPHIEKRHEIEEEIKENLCKCKKNDLYAIYKEAERMLIKVVLDDKETATSLNIRLEDIKVGGNLTWNACKTPAYHKNFIATKVIVGEDFTIGE